MIPGHIIFILCFFLCVIIAEGIIIFKLFKHEPDNIFGSGKTAEKIAIFKRFWGPFVVYVIATSIIALFIASFVANRNISLNDINTWVSLILGMVALVIGVISLFLSFYNVEQAYQSQVDNLNEMKKVQTEITRKIDSMHFQMKKEFNNMRHSKTKRNQKFSLKEKNSNKSDYEDYV